MKEFPIISRVPDVGYEEHIPDAYRTYIHQLYEEFWGKDGVIAIGIHPSKLSIISVTNDMNITGYNDHHLKRYLSFIRNLSCRDLLDGKYTIIYSIKQYHTISFVKDYQTSLNDWKEVIHQKIKRLPATYSLAGACMLSTVLWDVSALYKSKVLGTWYTNTRELQHVELNSYIPYPLSNYEIQLLVTFATNPCCGMIMTEPQYKTLVSKLTANLTAFTI